MEHIYYEVGTSLLAKPQALCDLVELETGHSCLVYCNSPSDADFADVILKKRGISSLKLIGYVPQIKLSKAIQQLQKKEVQVLVLTDVAARGLPLEEFEVVINYSVPTDPEIYFHRYASESEALKTQKVVSLVAALDISNFHYLKKLGKLEFVQGTLPTPESLFVKKFDSLRAQSIEKGLIADPSLATLVDNVLGDANARDIVALLLHNTLSVIPSLKAAPPAREQGEEYEGDGEEFDDEDREEGRRQGQGQGRDGRGGRDRGGRGGRDRGGRDNRGNRGGDRGGRRDFQQGDFEDLDEGQPRFSDEGEDEQPRRGRGRGRDRDFRDRDRRDDERSGEGREPRQPRQPRRQMVVDKEARLYVGSGSQQGVSGEALTNDVIALAGVNPSDVHRVSVRGVYSFVDVPEAVADQVVEKLSEGDKYFVKRAVTLAIPREGAAQEESSGADTHGDEGHHEAQHNGHDGDIGEGPTLLAVDETA